MCKKGGDPFCIKCAHMDHLVYLPSGDTALTSRARKHSTVSAVVLKWSTSRKRFERQGVLIEEEGLEKAQEECDKDADKRTERRKKDVLRRRKEDEVFAEEMTVKILDMYPSIPPEEAEMIAEHTTERGSRRVGRTSAAKELDEGAIDLAVRAHIRHRHTGYDEFLAECQDRQLAREELRDLIDNIQSEWSRPKKEGSEPKAH